MSILWTCWLQYRTHASTNGMEYRLEELSNVFLVMFSIIF